MSAPSEPDGDEQDPAKKPETVASKVMSALLEKANKSAATLAAMGITQDKRDSAARACAKSSTEKVIKQIFSYAVRVGEMEKITPDQILNEVARQSGVKLTNRKPFVRKNPPKKGGQNG